MNKFRVGNRVKAITDNYVDTTEANDCELIVLKIEGDHNFTGCVISSRDISTIGKEYECLLPDYFQLLSNKNCTKLVKEKPKDKYIVFADGCDNWSEVIYTDEDGIKAKMKYYDSRSDWKGEISAYKLAPVFKMKKKFLFTRFKKIVKVTKKKVKKKSKKRR